MKVPIVKVTNVEIRERKFLPITNGKEASKSILLWPNFNKKILPTTK